MYAQTISTKARRVVDFTRQDAMMCAEVQRMIYAAKKDFFVLATVAKRFYMASSQVERIVRYYIPGLLKDRRRPVFLWA